MEGECEETSGKDVDMTAGEAQPSPQEESKTTAVSKESETSGPEESKESDASAQNGDAEEVEEEVRDAESMCRFCFGEEEEGPGGNLISPCKCTGGQKWVHLGCLRKWQRSVLVTQPTHPMFYEDDMRQRNCNVCTSPFTCNPPSRHELMQGFTGEELAALLEEGCVITSHPQFSRDIRRQLQGFSPHMMEASNYLHWLDASYLITDVDDEPEQIRFGVSSNAAKEALISQLRENAALGLKLMGKRFVVVREGPLAGEDDLLEKIRTLPIGSVVSLAAAKTDEQGQETIIAVNLTRPFDPLPFHLQRATELAYERHRVHLVHFIGGPCQESECICILRRPFGPVGENWTVAPNGQWMWTKSLKSALELFPRVMKRPRSDSDDSSPENARDEEATSPVDIARKLPIISVYWGDARWSRTQLLGELAKGSWGMCHGCASDAIPSENATLADFTNFRKNELTKHVIGEERLFFAPKSEMTEHFLGAPISEEDERLLEQRMAEHREMLRRQIELQRQMQQVRARRRLQEASSRAAGPANPSSSSSSSSESSSGDDAGMSDDPSMSEGAMQALARIGPFLLPDDDEGACSESSKQSEEGGDEKAVDEKAVENDNDDSGEVAEEFFDILSGDDHTAPVAAVEDDMELVSCDSTDNDADVEDFIS
eukprot:GEMP01034856.1.p1 GENE.GEMP01034856.1~~GEMP01034856.1.p1  ORF type:complete len:671 (+),score=174.86 GEMP01034856.1:42-2015(+)